MAARSHIFGSLGLAPSTWAALAVASALLATFVVAAPDQIETAQVRSDPSVAGDAVDLGSVVAPLAEVWIQESEPLAWRPGDQVRSQSLVDEHTSFVFASPAVPETWRIIAQLETGELAEASASTTSASEDSGARPSSGLSRNKGSAAPLSWRALRPVARKSRRAGSEASTPEPVVAGPPPNVPRDQCFTLWSKGCSRDGCPISPGKVDC